MSKKIEAQLGYTLQIQPITTKIVQQLKPEGDGWMAI
jgi:hypothetical protein